MANCVSCGREIEPGTLFCEQCYAKMRGRRGPLRRVEGGAEGGSAAEVGGVAREEPATSGGAATRRASGTLTPASQKKVVSLRPELERERKEKYGKSRKRFTITITFSERTYEMLSRLGRGRKVRGKVAGPAAGEGGKAASPAEGRSARARRGPHGRPALKAVEGRTGRGGDGKAVAKGFMGWIARRERKWDGMDYAALLLAITAAVLILALSFAGWVRVSWGAADEPASYGVSIEGVDLGVLTYLIIVLAVAALLYIPAAWRLERWLRGLDFGVVLLLAGMLIIVLFYADIASNQRIFDIAYRLASQRGIYPEGVLVQRETMAAAYLMALMGVLMAFSGLVRLSERRETGAKAGGGG